MQAVPHQLAELFGQSVQRVLFPAGLRLSDDGLRKQHIGKGGSTLKGGVQQIKARVAEKLVQDAGHGAYGVGQHGDLGAVGRDLNVFLLAALLLQAVVEQRRGGAGEHGHGQRVQPHGKADGEQV